MKPYTTSTRMWARRACASGVAKNTETTIIVAMNSKAAGIGRAKTLVPMMSNVPASIINSIATPDRSANVRLVRRSQNEKREGSLAMSRSVICAKPARGPLPSTRDP